MKIQALLSIAALGGLTLMSACESWNDSRTDDRAGNRTPTRADSSTNEASGRYGSSRSDPNRNDANRTDAYRNDTYRNDSGRYDQNRTDNNNHGSNPNYRDDSSRNATSNSDPYQWDSNERVSNEVRRALSRDNAMNTDVQSWKITTDKDGLVTLQGWVSTQAEKDRMENRARGVSGVSNVNNRLEIRGT